ncbi:MAG TPA: FMN-binding protein [Thermotogota bacterium]|nr:FMN-binding protein [Thermotogota bacterium]HPJ90248.1 FMN-binding protein [Thermotogota bacterium]HPR97345.1 FMN-binding protein [Thermotogota bacterium]
MKKKRWLIILIIVVSVVIIAGIFAKDFLDKTEKELEELEQLGFAEIDISGIPDGSYNGYYKQFPIEVELITTVKDGRISDIEIKKHITGQGQEAENITSAVIREQSLTVDTITGATYSSLVILKAVEDSLLNLKK